MFHLKTYFWAQNVNSHHFCHLLILFTPKVRLRFGSNIVFSVSCKYYYCKCCRIPKNCVLREKNSVFYLFLGFRNECLGIFLRPFFDSESQLNILKRNLENLSFFSKKLVSRSKKGVFWLFLVLRGVFFQILTPPNCSPSNFMGI